MLLALISAFNVFNCVVLIIIQFFIFSPLIRPNKQILLIFIGLIVFCLLQTIQFAVE